LVANTRPNQEPAANISLTKTGDNQEKYMFFMRVIMDMEETDSWVQLHTATNENEMRLNSRVLGGWAKKSNGKLNN
jgi:hypothetical protein